MRSMCGEDQAQLRQIEAKLAQLNAMPVAEQARKRCLIDALEQGRDELLRCVGRTRRAPRLAA